MDFLIERAQDWDEYRTAWSALMKDYYWYKEDPVFDWNKHDECKEMQETFSSPGYGYYYAKRNRDSKIIGLVGISLRNDAVVIRRWEPAVADQHTDVAVANSLLEHVIAKAVDSGKSMLGATVKYPVGSQQANWHLDLYRRHDFVTFQQPQVGLLMKMPPNPFALPSVEGVGITDSDDFSDEEVAELTVACFTGTEADQRIHQDDSSVTDYPTAVQVIKNIRSEKFMHSHDQWQVAVADGKPVGVVGSMISPNRSGPQVGILGPVGMLPEYRRRGITSLLVLSVLNALLRTGCEFTAVGTPEQNYPAIRLYERLGFEDHERLIRLRRVLKSE